MVSSSARYRRASARAASRTASSASALSNPRGLGDDAAIARYDDGGRGPHRRAFGYAEGVLVSLLHDETRSVRAREKAPKEGPRTKGRRARLRRIRNLEFGRLWEKISPPRRATYAFRVLRPLVVSLRRLTPPSRSSRSTTPRVASSQDGFYRRFPPRHRSRVGRVQAWRHAPRARARYVPRGRDIPARPLACG